jgi:ureidoacrylate peracid hydrolase
VTAGMLRALEEKAAPGHTALLIVDVQNDFCSDDGAFARLGRDLSRIQNMLTALERLLAAAREAGVTVIFLRYAQTPVTESPVHLEQRSRGRSDIAYCQEGTPGADFYRIGPQPGEIVVTKHRYSGFIGTDLDLILRSRGIRTLVMTGVATNGCVEATARDGFMHDYYIVFTSDGAACYSAELHNATLTNILDAYGVVASCDEMAALWASGSAATPARAAAANAVSEPDLAVES